MSLLGKEATSFSTVFSNMNRILSKFRRTKLSLLWNVATSLSTVAIVSRIVNTFRINALSLLGKEVSPHSSSTVLSNVKRIVSILRRYIDFASKRVHFFFNCSWQSEYNSVYTKNKYIVFSRKGGQFSFNCIQQWEWNCD